MSSSPEDFEKLRRLLVCKRHEVPPPGYFHRFSDSVMARIEAEDGAVESGWWQWLVSRFDARPFWACAYGFAVSSLLLMGFRLSQIFEGESVASLTPAGSWLAATPDPSTVQGGSFLQANLRTSSGLSSFSSVSPEMDMQPQSSRFPTRPPHILPVSYSFGH